MKSSIFTIILLLFTSSHSFAQPGSGSLQGHIVTAGFEAGAGATVQLQHSNIKAKTDEQA